MVIHLNEIMIGDRRIEFNEENSVSSTLGKFDCCGHFFTKTETLSDELTIFFSFHRKEDFTGVFHSKFNVNCKSFEIVTESLSVNIMKY